MIGATVVVLDDISLGPTNSGLKKGETGLCVARSDGCLFIQFATPHHDWPSQWRNELMLPMEDIDILNKLKFTEHY